MSRSKRKGRVAAVAPKLFVVNRVNGAQMLSSEMSRTLQYLLDYQTPCPIPVLLRSRAAHYSQRDLAGKVKFC